MHRSILLVLTRGSLAASALLTLMVPASAEIVEQTETYFKITHEAHFPGVAPEELYDVMTGDITPWWDHHFSATPHRLEIEAQPGGRFVETFDETGDGVEHARVTFAHRGKRLTMVGPLAFVGLPLDLHITWTYESTDDGTLLKIAVHGYGQFEPSWAEAIDGVWVHFIFENLRPYVLGARILTEDEMQPSPGAAEMVPSDELDAPAMRNHR